MEVRKITTFSTDKEEKELIEKTMNFLEKVRDIVGDEEKGEISLCGDTVMTYENIEQMLAWLTSFICDEIYDVY